MTADSFPIGYHHTQNAKWLTALMIGAAVLVAVLGLTQPNPSLIVAAGLFVLTWLFHSLTIEISEGELRWRFGPGLIHKNIPLVEIASARIVRTNILEGWGIHLSRFGWLYNVSGFDAVAITLRSGKRFALGTDDPQELCSRLTAFSGGGPIQNQNL
jgi:hypothetical protein